MGDKWTALQVWDFKNPNAHTEEAYFILPDVISDIGGTSKIPLSLHLLPGSPWFLSASFYFLENYSGGHRVLG